MTGACSAVVASFGQRYEAELARGYLADAGIPTALAVDDGGGAYAGLHLSFGAAEVRVRRGDLVRARRVLLEAGLVEGGEGEEAE